MEKFSNSKELQQILDRYVKGQASEDDIRFLNEYDRYLESKNVSAELSDGELEDINQSLYKSIKGSIKREHTFHLPHIYKYAAAAIVVIGLSIFLYTFRSGSNKETTAHDILPAGNHGTLTLADGTIVDLDTAALGLLTQQYGTNINKSESGVISYHIDEDKTQLDIAATNTITTPRGGYYKVILPDSSCVWVNAASSLRFPTRFAEDERRVELAGEAYFEVAKNTKKPFIVKSGQQQIQVLGTEFNARSYKGEPTVTTLISGKVKVNHYSLNKILQPGQQAISSAAGMELKTVDIEDFVGWKNNVFIFHRRNLREIMHEMERWYDVEAEIPAKESNELFYAEIPRNIKLSEALKMLEGTSDIRFKIEGRRIMIK